MTVSTDSSKTLSGGASAPLTLASGTITADSPALTMTQTWNNVATTFTGFKFDATDTASASGSLLMDLQVGGASKFKVAKSGVITFAGLNIYADANAFVIKDANGNPAAGFRADFALLPSAGKLGWSDATGIPGLNADLSLYRDAAGVLAQRNGANAQAFRVYNTYTDASNYERASLTWAGNVAYLKAENAGTGVVRLFVPVTGATTVASLPLASTAGAGARSFVTDATATTFLSTVAGGGTNKVPVVSDGTNWLIG